MNSFSNFKEKEKSSNWYNQDFMQQFVVDSLKEHLYDNHIIKDKHQRTKSLTTRLESEKFFNEINQNSTNQTSVEISMDEIFVPFNDIKMPNTVRNLASQENNLNFKNEIIESGENDKSVINDEKKKQ